jgi:hypothetical protein
MCQKKRQGNYMLRNDVVDVGVLVVDVLRKIFTEWVVID